MRMIGDRKGQAAIEYVHTYGWVFISAMVLGGALLYFNLSGSQGLVPTGCQFLSGIRCLDVVVEDDLLSIAIVNEFGFDISNITLNVTGTCNSTANMSDGNPFSNPNVMLANDQDTVTFQCQNLSNIRASERIIIGYRNMGSGNEHIKVGRLDYSPLGK